MRIGKKNLELLDIAFARHAMYRLALANGGNWEYEKACRDEALEKIGFKFQFSHDKGYELTRIDAL